MAVRDRNLFAWQAYVIVMSIVSVGLLLGLGYMVFANSTATKQALDAATKSKELEQKLAQEFNKQQYMMHMLGAKQATEQEVGIFAASVSGVAEMETLIKNYNRDMALLGGENAQQDKNYSSLVTSLMKSLRIRNLQNDKASKDIARLTDEMEKVRDQETNARKSAEADRDRLAKELASARDDYKNKEGEMKKEIDQLIAEKSSLQATFVQKENALKASVAKFKDENDKLLKFKASVLQDRLKNEEREDFESAQGKVVSVDQNGVIAFINMGSKQGLRPGLLFNIYNADTIRISEATPKAKIEISKVMENQSMVNVLNSSKNVPIISNDLVYSPTWSAGRKVKFALVGKLDINSDGEDDRQLVKSLIEQNNGEVIEDVGPDTKPGAKKMDLNTRYLVVGEMPSGLEGRSGDDRSKEAGSRYAEIRQRARELNVMELSIEKLVGMLRKVDDDRTVGLGDATRSEDFKPRFPSGPAKDTTKTPLSGAGPGR